MAERLVVYSVGSDAAAHGAVAEQLRARGVEIVEEQPHMILVSGSGEQIGLALEAVRGWKVTGLTTTPLPDQRYRVRKPPS